MFVLLKRVSGWRAEMLARGVFSRHELDELEDHLLEEARRIAEAGGHSDEEAYLEALRSLGTVSELECEYRHAHEMLPIAPGWRSRLLKVLQGIAEFAQGVLVVCLPGMVMCVPALVFQARETVFRETVLFITDLRVRARELAGLERCLAWLIHYWWLTLPAILVILIAPSLLRIRQTREQSGMGFGACVIEEMVRSRRLLLAGILAYPLVGLGFLRIAFDPLFRMIYMLGG